MVYRLSSGTTCIKVFFVIRIVIRQSPQQTKICTPKLRIDKYYMRTFGVQPLGCLFLFKATDVLRSHIPQQSFLRFYPFGKNFQSESASYDGSHLHNTYPGYTFFVALFLFGFLAVPASFSTGKKSTFLLSTAMFIV